MSNTEALRLADAIDPLTRKQAPDHLTVGAAAAALRALAQQPAASGEPAEPVAWAQLGMRNGHTYVRYTYEREPYPPPPDVQRNLNLVPLYATAQPAPAPAAGAEPVTLADVLDALNLFNRPKPSEDDGPWEGGHLIRADHLPDFINIIAAAWFAPQPALACAYGGIADLRDAKWLDPQCADRGACQSLLFKATQPAPALVPLTETQIKDFAAEAETPAWGEWYSDDDALMRFTRLIEAAISGTSAKEAP